MSAQARPGTSRFNDVQVVITLTGVVRCSHVLTGMENAEQTQTWNEEDWIEGLSRSTDKPSMEHCEDQNGTIVNIGALQGFSHGVAINPQFL